MKTHELVAEVRPLPDHHTLLSFKNGKHYSLSIGVADFFRIIDAWFTGQPNSLLPSSWREDSRPLYELLKAEGGILEKEAISETYAVSLSSEVDISLGKPSGARNVLITGDSDLANLISQVVREIIPEKFDVSIYLGEYGRTLDIAKEADAIVLQCLPSADDVGLGFFGRLATQARVDWIPLSVERDYLWIGPLVKPGEGAQFQDLHERRIAAADHEMIGRVLREQPLNILAIPVDLVKWKAKIATAIGRVLGAPDLLCQMHIGTGEMVDHVILPIPRNPDVIRKRHCLEDLVSSECGIITRERRIEHHASIPASLLTIQVEVACMDRISQWDNVISCQGSAWNDEQSARLAALGETAERYSANMHDTRSAVHSTYERLRRQGFRAVSPESLILYSDAQYAAPSFPAEPFLGDTELTWIKGVSETTEEEIFVPASLVYTNWRKGERIHEPLIHISPFAGVAAGPTREFALVSAIEELVERHATMLWWLNGAVLDRVKLPTELAALWDGCNDQDASLIQLPNEFGIPVAAGILRERRARLLNIGFAARSNLKDAALKAWTEAITLQEGSRDLLKADSKHLQAIKSGIIPAGAMKPYRNDRCYLNDFKPDFSDCTDLMVQQQIYLDPRSQKRVAHLIDTPATVDLNSVACVEERSLRSYRALIEARGYEIISVDITPPDVKSLGIFVVRALIPGLLGNAAAAYPMLGRGRVFDIPVELGWRESPLDEFRMNRMPLPHA